jgi:hypothetical protein
MPILSFSVLKPKLIARIKTQTIRKPREKRPFKVGDKLFIWWKSRTPQREKLGEGTITAVLPIRIYSEENIFKVHEVNPHTFIITEYTQKLSKEELDEIAKRDGFETWSELFAVLSAWYSFPYTLEVIQFRWED